MKKLFSCTICLFILMGASLFAQPAQRTKKPPVKPQEPRYINPIQDINIVGDVFTKGKGSRKQIFLRDELGEEYILKVDDTYSKLYYEDLFVYDGYTVRIVGTLDARTSVIEVRLIRVRQIPEPKKKSPPPKKEEAKAPKKQTPAAPKKDPALPKKEPLPPKKEEAPKAPKK